MTRSYLRDRVGFGRDEEARDGRVGDGGRLQSCCRLVAILSCADGETGGLRLLDSPQGWIVRLGSDHDWIARIFEMRARTREGLYPIPLIWSSCSAELAT